MRAEQLIVNLKEAIRTNTASMLHGSPGVGKSAIVHQVAKELGLGILDYRLSQVDSVDLRGVPSIKDGRTHWNPPAEFPHEGEGLFFLDEINSAPQSVQAAAYQLVLDRKLGTYVLPPGWIPVAAGNRLTDRAIVNQMPTPLRNRFIHFELDSSIDDWCSWAMSANVPEQMIAFLRFRPNLLDEFSQADSATKIKDSNTIATPRSWEIAGRFVASVNRLSMMSSTVGTGPAAEFESYLQVYEELPDLDALMKNPKLYKAPKNPGALYAIATGIAARMTENMPMKNFFAIVDQMPIEFGALAVKDSQRRVPTTAYSKEFLVWSTKNFEMWRK